MDASTVSWLLQLKFAVSPEPTMRRTQSCCAYYSKILRRAADQSALEFHDFSSSLAPVEADARVFTASGAVLAPSNRAPKLSFADCFLASPATGASSPRRTRRLRPCGLSTFRMLAADRNAPLAETRIGLASGLRGDLRPPPERPSPSRTTKTLSVSPSVRV